MFNRWIEAGLLDVLGDEGVGCIAFTALAQGLLTNRYLNGIPEDSRAAQGKSLDPGVINDENLARIQALNEIAEDRGQTLAQLALAWVLRDPRMTSTLIGASSVQAARGQCRSHEEPGVQRRRAGRHRGAGRRLRRRPLGAGPRGALIAQYFGCRAQKKQ